VPDDDTLPGGEPRPPAAGPGADGQSGPPHGYVALPGSERAPMPGSRLIGAAPPDERITVTLVLRRKAALPPVAAPGAEGPRQPLSRAQFAALYGAEPQDITRVEQFAGRCGLQVTGSDVARRSVALAGTAKSFAGAFAVELLRYATAGHTYRSFAGPIHLPADLAGIVEGVFGLDDRPVAASR
jgi:kumamolisin